MTATITDQGTGTPTGGATGRVSRVIGPVIDAEFPANAMPEIYNANAGAGEVYRPRLDHGDFSQTRIAYDREERARLGREQGEYTQEHFVGPHRDLLERWAAAHAARDNEETR